MEMITGWSRGKNGPIDKKSGEIENEKCKLLIANSGSQKPLSAMSEGMGKYPHLFSIDVLRQGLSLTPMNRFSRTTALRRRLSMNSRLFSTVAVMAVLVLAVCPGRADDPDAQYLHLFDLIQQGDTLKKNGQIDNALAKYREAQVGLSKFQRSYPERSGKSVAYRLNYISAQI